MNGALLSLPGPAIPLNVQEFADEKGIKDYLNPLIDLARQAFPKSPLSISLGQDAEDETHRYIAIDVEVPDTSTQDLLAGQRMWSAGVGRVCPSRHAVYFVLGWR